MDKTLKKQEDMLNFVASRIPWEVPLSVNDFNKVGQINSSCPYYLMKSRINQCDLAIIPYNYVLDADLRSQINLNLENSVLIFDEGHNIESQCEELLAFELSINDLFCSYQILNQIWLDLQAEE
jgi:regulator of telomere elongation helicase 1